MGLDDLSDIIWDECEVDELPDEINGLQLYSIFYRKDLGDNKYQYNIQTEDKSKSLIVQLAGIRQNKDPFDDVYDIDVQLDDSEKSIIGIRIDYHCVIQRC